MGSEVFGLTTIVPLFLAYCGADLALIGSVTTLQSLFQALTPLLFGGIVAAVKSKRNFSMVVNGISRSAILLIPAGILLGLPVEAELILFFAVILVYLLCQGVFCGLGLFFALRLRRGEA